MIDNTRLIRFDWAIKNIFKKNKKLDILQGFISDLLQKKITSIKLCDNEGIKDSFDDKSNRVDVHVVSEEGEEIIIEVQAYSEWDYFGRLLYGTSKVITNHMKTGYKYCKVPKVISISICYFEIGEGKDYLYKGSTNFVGMNHGDTLNLNDNERKMYIEKAQKVDEIYPEYYIIKVNKFGNEVKNLIDEWIYFFKMEEVKKDFHSEALKKAFKHLQYLKMSRVEKLRYEVFLENIGLEKSLEYSKEIEVEVRLEKAERAGLEKGIAKGLERGLEEGMKEGMKEGMRNKELEIAKKLLEKNITIKEIMELTSLKEEEIKSLVAE